MTEIFNKSFHRERRRILRNQMPLPEQRLWYFLRLKQFEGFRFRRQYGMGSYIVDFYCPSKKLVIELDGDSHARQDAQAYDEARQTSIESLGVRVIRFSNSDVMTNMDAVLGSIREALSEPPPTPPS